MHVQKDASDVEACSTSVNNQWRWQSTCLAADVLARDRGAAERHMETGKTPRTAASVRILGMLRRL
jgi:hypothetical protein